ncbi:LPXTG cell wall anchor domain-containing protein [Lactobacillus acidophilus]|uniref:LPXTG cell wall anchor domain-containing protein n=1 Tax=Lactobacillus acidophilus TaxID=1579 RepID=UPI0021A67644|nr:LPXTG cell wall anchor domain-containing protein [Lactobacillus acidophilus]
MRVFLILKRLIQKKHSANKSNLPKTGEDNIELFFSIVGTIFLSISAIFFYKKSRK